MNIEKLKKCYKCNNIKKESEFHNQKTRKIQSHCKQCSLLISKEYYKNNKSRQNYFKKYRLDNLGKIRKQQREYMKTKRKNNILYNLRNRFSVLIRYSLKNNKHSKWEKILNYTLEDLKKHLEVKFENGMTWDHFLKGNIHIDHIVPMIKFNIKSEYDNEFKRCWSLTNLQPLWAKDNLRKGCK